MSRRVRVGIVSLGCPKTLVDSETILGKLSARRFQLAGPAAGCEVVIVNTCSFIRDARQESVEKILELIELKKSGRLRCLVVVGCLVQQFPDELRGQMGEVDAFLGTGQYDEIARAVDRALGGEKVFSVEQPGYLATSLERRVRLSARFSRYLKISEGCDRRCSFCTIPQFRGKHRSRTPEDIFREARRLAAEGAKELILTGQDTTGYGKDLAAHPDLPLLLTKLDRIGGLRWIRLLYAYPSCVTPELIATLRDARHVCHYLDLPIQHASDRILRAMRRGTSRSNMTRLIGRLRRAVPEIALRTTFIVGFPGETERDFRELLDFIREIRFERLGIFTYSAEQGTPAAKLPGQIAAGLKRERLDRAMRLQQTLSLENHRRWTGRELEVLVEEKVAGTHNRWVGRSYREAPEIDGRILIDSARPLSAGRFYRVTITGGDAYDLVAKS
ncbi:MAG: 30S ribosomal protein S12 methylthiotransferase RimO [Candidatus Omnitrophota bacterium]|jgi:ribosomal protein S12 methylthiotransferase